MPLFLDNSIFGEGRLWIWETTEDGFYFESRINLRPYDRKRLAQIGNPEARKHWLAYRFMLSSVDDNPVYVDYDEFGKPFPNHKNYEIAVSHSGKMAAIAVHQTKRIGLDVEYFRPQVERVAHRVFSQYEIDFIGNSNRIVYLTLLWAAKEAMFKLIGEGNVDYRNDLNISKIDICDEGSFGGFYLRNNIKFNVEFYYKVFNNFVVVSCVNE